MLTSSDGDAEIQRAMRAGASTYVLKSMPKDEPLAVSPGRSMLEKTSHPRGVAAASPKRLDDDDLTARELDVLRLVRDGNRGKQVADRLDVAKLPSISTSRTSWNKRRNQRSDPWR